MWEEAWIQQTTLQKENYFQHTQTRERERDERTINIWDHMEFESMKTPLSIQLRLPHNLIKFWVEIQG